jgi:hypothetical protein
MRQTRATGGHPARVYRGVLLGWPRDGAPLVVLLSGASERTLTTSHVRRVLHDDTRRQMFVETRNTIYRVVCEAGCEDEWTRETARSFTSPSSFSEETATDVGDEPSAPFRKVDRD